MKLKVLMKHIYILKITYNTFGMRHIIAKTNCLNKIINLKNKQKILTIFKKYKKKKLIILYNKILIFQKKK